MLFDRRNRFLSGFFTRPKSCLTGSSCVRYTGNHHTRKVNAGNTSWCCKRDRKYRECRLALFDKVECLSDWWWTLGAAVVPGVRSWDYCKYRPAAWENIAAFQESACPIPDKVDFKNDTNGQWNPATTMYTLPTRRPPLDPISFPLFKLPARSWAALSCPFSP